MKKQKGITLIALIITIIILLILAGISIASLTGSGLFEKAKLAKNNTLDAQIKENKILEEYLNYIDNYNSNEKKEDWQILLSYINESESGYSNLDDIISNNEIMKKLINNSNSINYMIENPEKFINEISSSEELMKTVSQSKDASYKIVKNETWLNAVSNSAYANKFDEEALTVPELTSTNYTGLIQSSCQDWSYNGPYKVFDKNEGTTNGDGVWISDGSKQEGEYVGYDFGNEVALYKVYISNIRTDIATQSLMTFKIQGSNDNQTWEDITEVLEFNNYQSTITKNIISSKNYSKYRIYSITSSGSNYVSLSEARFYCREK